jgi:nucleoside transporter
MQNKVKVQLSAMMFLEFFIWGAWYVTMWKYLSAIKFDNIIGLAYSATGIAAIISPLFIGMIADRFFSTEKVLAVLHILGGILMFWVSEISDSTVFFWVLLAYTLCYMPTLALTNSISLCQMSDPEKEFPPIRVLGTIGWIIAGLIIGFMPESISGLATIENTSIPMKIAAAASLVMGFYCLTLPHTPPPSAGKKASVKDVLGLDALKMLRDPQFAIFVICSFLICIPLAFYYQSANGFLGEVGVENAAGKMTLGQISEFFFMLVMPFFFVRLGVKKMLLVGMLAWVARYLMFAFGNNGSLVFMLYIGILLHGICYDFFFVTGQIYIDKKAPKEIRSSAQGFLALITLGLGMIIGSLINGKVTRYYETAGDIGHNWKMIWLIPCIMAGVVAILFGIMFKDEISAKKIKNQPTGAANEFK